MGNREPTGNKPTKQWEQPAKNWEQLTANRKQTENSQLELKTTKFQLGTEYNQHLLRTTDNLKTEDTPREFIHGYQLVQFHSIWSRITGVLTHVTRTVDELVPRFALSSKKCCVPQENSLKYSSHMRSSKSDFKTCFWGIPSSQLLFPAKINRETRRN
jgi:hypothetical protein